MFKKLSVFNEFIKNFNSYGGLDQPCLVQRCITVWICGHTHAFTQRFQGWYPLRHSFMRSLRSCPLHDLSHFLWSYKITWYAFLTQLNKNLSYHVTHCCRNYFCNDIKIGGEHFQSQFSVKISTQMIYVNFSRIKQATL